NKEIEFLENQLLEHGIERKLVGTNNIKNHHEYKELQEELEKLEEEYDKKLDDFMEIQDEIKELKEEKEELIEVAENTHIEELKGYGNESTPKGYILIKKADFGRLKEQNESVPFIISENRYLNKQNKELKEENTEKDTQVHDLNEMLEMARRRLN